MSRLQTLTDRTGTRFAGKYYDCEMPSSSHKRNNDWPCDEVVGDVDCYSCPLDQRRQYEDLLESLCLESAQ